MKFNEKYQIAQEFEHLFSFANEFEELEHEEKLLSIKFLSEFEKIINDKDIKRKDIALALKTSPSYITQLFKGDRLVNIPILIKIQEKYNFTFEINAINNKQEYSEKTTKYPFQTISIKQSNSGFVLRPNYHSRKLNHSENLKSQSA